MFKNRSLQMKVVKDRPTNISVSNIDDNIDAISDMIADNTKTIALAAAFVIGTKTFSELILHIAKTRIK